MKFIKNGTLLLIFILLVSPVSAGDNDYHLAVSSGQFDVINGSEPSFEGRIELRKYAGNNIINLVNGFMANADGGMFFYSGLFTEIHLFSLIYIHPSFTPGIYFKNGSKNLNYHLEFKSQIEIGFILKNESRLGVSFNHISNAGLGPPNPGVESLVLTYSFSIY